MAGIKRHIDEHLGDPDFGAAQVAEAFGLSRPTLYRLFEPLGGVAAYNEEQALQSGAAPISAWQFLGTSDFWFQSMQNWQSEFLAVGVLILLSIVLRQHASPESKPVTAPHAQTSA